MISYIHIAFIAVCRYAIAVCLLPIALTVSAAETLATLDFRVLPEASGIAVSPSDERRLWFVNDSGNRAELIAYDLRSDSYTRVKIDDVKNRDWEDLAAFEYAGNPWLAIADVGDNQAKRKNVRIYLLPEPSPGATRASAPTQIKVRYPDGPRDVESLAVDASGSAIYLLSKRDSFPRLYRVDLPALDKARDYAVTAEYLGEVRSIPKPDAEEIASYPYGKNRARPTAMDLLPDGSAVALMTYRGAYLAPLAEDRDWLKALNQSLCPVPGPMLDQAETITADKSARLYLTSEGRRAPLLRISPQCSR
jgi:hypothetical protein